MLARGACVRVCLAVSHTIISACRLASVQAPRLPAASFQGSASRPTCHWGTPRSFRRCSHALTCRAIRVGRGSWSSDAWAHAGHCTVATTPCASTAGGTTHCWGERRSQQLALCIHCWDAGHSSPRWQQRLLAAGNPLTSRSLRAACRLSMGTGCRTLHSGTNSYSGMPCRRGARGLTSSW
jgi:hypothetical protein